MKSEKSTIKDTINDKIKQTNCDTEIQFKNTKFMFLFFPEELKIKIKKKEKNSKTKRS